MQKKDEIDLEGLEDVEDVVIQAIIEGVNKTDPNIHPDLNSPAHPIPKKDELVPEEVGKNWVDKIKEKIKEIRKKDPEIYPLF